MRTEHDPVAVDRQFFTWLTEANVCAVDELLTNDFLLIDVMRGGEIPKSERPRAVPLPIQWDRGPKDG